MTIVSIVIATGIAFLFSSFFYFSSVMGHTWQKSLGHHLEKKELSASKKSMQMVTTFVLFFLQFFILAFFIDQLGANTVHEAVVVSIMMWLFVQTGNYVKGMREHKKMQTLNIEALEDFIRILLGAIVMVMMM